MVQRIVRRVQRGSLHRVKPSGAFGFASQHTPPSVYNYAADAGQGSSNFESTARWRQALLGTVTAGAMFFGYGRRADAGPDPCTTAVNVATCQGDQSDGITNQGGTPDFTSPPVDTLNVNNLTANIAPASGVDGINFTSVGAITIIIDVTPYGIVTTGAGADGIFAQSSTGAITVDSTGDITANNARGIYARSFGAGTTVSVTSVGGVNGIQAASDGIYARSSTGAVTVDSTGDITSDNSRGIFAANFGANAVSVTSAGGASGIQAASYGIYARSSTGAVTVDSTGDITSDNSWGILAFNYGVGAGTVSVTSAGDIQANADGILAQSSTGAVTVDSTGDITSTSGSGIFTRNFGAGAVSVTNAGSVNGIQAASDGIFAQSSAGAITIDSTGDITSTNGRGFYARSSGAGAVSVTNAGGVNGIQANFEGIYARSSTGAVTVDSAGDVTSDNARGILAFNYGVGAGTVSVASAGDIQANADGILAQSSTGAVTVDSTGDITSTSGSGIFTRNFGAGAISVTNVGGVNGIQAGSDGIYARSSTGAITVDSTGDITSNLADAVVGRSAANIDITLRSGDVFGANDGVEFYAGATNTLKNYAALSGGVFAVHGGLGNETVHNYNVISGDVNLGAGVNAFFNRATGVFNAGATVNLGAANTLTNAGNLNPGGVGTVQTTALTGSLVQTASGVFTVDLNGASNDLVTITGTANFAGLVAPHIISLTGPSGSAVIADAAGAVTNSATAVDTPIVDFFLSLGDGTQLVLNWQPTLLANLLSGPLTPNQQATAAYIDAVTTAGAPPPLQALIDALKLLPDEAAMVAALDRLHPEHYLAHVKDTVLSSLSFMNSVMSCPTAGGQPAVVSEGECYWAKVGGRAFDWDRTNTNVGGSEEAWSIAGGVQVALPGNWRLGAAASYERSDIDTNNSASSEGDRVEGAVVLKTHWGGASLAAAAFGGYGWFNTNRFIGLAGIGSAHGEHEIAFGGAHTRLGYLFDQGGWYMRPMVDLNATYIDYGDFAETGGGAANLAVEGRDDWVLSASPALEIGGESRSADGSVVRPYLRMGFTVLNDADFALTSSFLAAPAGVQPFTVTSRFDDAYLDVGAGVDLMTVDGLDVKLNYEGRFADDSEMHAGGLKVGAKF